MLAPATGQQPSKELMEALNRDFGSLDQFREKFNASAKSVFGSGWTWLVLDGEKLKITATPNQDSPVMDIVTDKGYPLLCLDVWEHAYYLKYQNRRAEYIDAFWNVINWDFVSQSNTILRPCFSLFFAQLRIANLKFEVDVFLFFITLLKVYKHIIYIYLIRILLTTLDPSVGTPVPYIVPTSTFGPVTSYVTAFNDFAGSILQVTYFTIIYIFVFSHIYIS